MAKLNWCHWYRYQSHCAQRFLKLEPIPHISWHKSRNTTVAHFQSNCNTVSFTSFDTYTHHDYFTTTLLYYLLTDIYRFKVNISTSRFAIATTGGRLNFYRLVSWAIHYKKLISVVHTTVQWKNQLWKKIFSSTQRIDFIVQNLIGPYAIC